jgi:hypothetical protein
MSYGTYMAGPPPDDNRRCPQCGAALKPGEPERCWLCLEKFSIQEGAPEPVGRDRASSAQPGKSVGDKPALAFFGGLVVLVCGALAFEAPGILLMLLILATPALIRTVVVKAGAGPATPAGGMTFVGTLLGSLGVTVLIGVASFVAFFATCFVVCYGAVSLSSGHPWGEDWIFGVSICAGLVPGLAVAVWLFRYFWVRKG